MIFGRTGGPAQTKPQAKSQTKSKLQAKKALPALKIHSMASSMTAGHFSGRFEAPGASAYSFTYAPERASLVDQKLELRGRLTVTGARGRSSSRDNVRAVLIGTQGGIGTAPTAAQTPAPAQTPAQTPALPEVDSTGPLSFCGVMYFQFEPLDGRALGVPADLSRVQLNARLAPGDEAGRNLHAVYSSLVASLNGEGRDARAAALALEELNRSLGR